MSTEPSARSRIQTILVGLRSTVIGALLGSVAAALTLALWEGSAVVDGGAGPRSVVAVLTAAFVVASASALLAAVLTLMAQVALCLMERQRIPWDLVLATIAGASLAVLGAQAWVLVALSGAGIRTAVVALSAALGVGASTALVVALRAIADRLGWTASLRVRVAWLIAGCAATIVLTVCLAPGLTDELDVGGIVAISIPLGAGVAIAIRGIDKRWLVRSALGAWLVLGAFALAHAAGPSVSLGTIQRETDAARVVLEALRKKKQLPPFPPGTGTCRAGVKPGVLEGAAAPAKAGAPNIVVITADSLRWDHTTLGGYKRDTTPELKRWSKSAAVFTSAYSPAASTRQTFRALFSGLHPSLVPPSKARIWWGVSLPPQQVSLAERLKHAGYRTVSASFEDRGFTRKHGGLKGFDRVVPKVSGKGGTAKRNVRATRAQMDIILKELKEAKGKPVFSWGHLLVSHQPYAIDPRSPFGTTEIDRFDGAIQFVDAEIGRLLRALKKEDLLKNTYVFVSADHGQAFYEHGTHLHGKTVYQEESHVPLVVLGPEVKPGKRKEAVALLDIFPTILELAGAPAAPEACGGSLVPWLRDPKKPSTRPVYIEQVPDVRSSFQVGYQRGRHMLVYTPRWGSFELFDMEADPRQARDLAETKTELTGELVRELIELHRKRGVDPAAYGLP